MSRRHLVAGAIAILSVGLLAPASANKDDAPEGPVSWLSTGDSYSSGEGVFGNEGPCAQSPNAWGPLTADRLTMNYGWTISPKAFTACSGALVEGFFNPTDLPSLYEWGLAQGVPQRVDVITLSFGGNDVGFAEILEDCIIVPDSWVDFAFVSGCDVSEVDIQDRINALLDPPLTGCVGGREISVVDGDPYRCDLMIHPDGQRGSYIDFLVRLAEDNLTPRGRVYVAGYPSVFARSDSWPDWSYAMCAGVKRGDAEKLERLAEYMDTTLKLAVEATNRRLGTEAVVYLSRYDLFRDGAHELCGNGEDWINGISNNRDATPENRKAGSFHPNKEGHSETSSLLLDVLTTTENALLTPAHLPPSDAEVGLQFDIGSIEEILSADHGWSLIFDRYQFFDASGPALREEPSWVGASDFCCLNENPRLRRYSLAPGVKVLVVDPEWLDRTCTNEDAGPAAWDKRAVEELGDLLNTQGRFATLTFNELGYVTRIRFQPGC